MKDFYTTKHCDYDEEKYTDDFDGTEADFMAMHNYDHRNGKVYGSTRYAHPYFANQLGFMGGRANG